MCKQEEQAINRGITMLYRYKKRGVYIVCDTNGKWRALLALHVKGTVCYTVAMNESNEAELIQWST